jgi:hypothetical protein
MTTEEIQESKYLASEEIQKILHEEDDPDRPLAGYDLSALYMQIGLDFLVPHDEMIAILRKELSNIIWRQARLCKLLREELEQIQGFRKNIESKNLDGRLIALEEKTPRKYKPKYK